MLVLEGKAVCGGIAEGILEIYRKEEFVGQSYLVGWPESNRGEISENRTETETETETEAEELVTGQTVDINTELNQYKQAKAEAIRQLKCLCQRAYEAAGEEEAAIFTAHRLLIEDPNYEEAVCRNIQERGMRAVGAVREAGEAIAGVFASLEDAYIRARAADIRDVSERLIKILSSLKPGNDLEPGENWQERQKDSTEKVILLAEDFTPSETIQMDKSRIAAFVTQRGSEYSHTAILAKTLGIPAVVGLCGDSLPAEWAGLPAIVDGKNGKLYIDPDETTRAALQAQRQKELQKKQRLEALKGKENRTLGGQTIELYANIGSVEDAEAALEQDAGGIGLFRSEFLYLGETDYPTEERQFAAYRAVVERMAGRPVVIRTLDIGADKQAGYFGLEPEENPAMGYRAIRICLERPELFRVQLRAIYRASQYGTVRLLLPMITSLKEVQEAEQQIEKARQELEAEGIPYGKVKLGVMIETPAAALISDLLAEEVEFFSIGTNDLIQYTLAADRQNPRLGRFYQPYHEGVLRLIRLVMKNAHQAGRPVGICGELAADLQLTEEWLRLGVDELSVAPSMILPVRERIRGCK